MQTHRTWLFLGAATAGLALATFLLRPSPGPPSPVPADRTTRAFNLQGMRPTLSSADTEALLDQSDTVVARLHAEGSDHIGRELRARLSGVEPTEDQRRAFFEANRHLFGQRSYHQSRWTVDQLLRIQLVRADLGIERASPYHGGAPVTP